MGEVREGQDCSNPRGAEPPDGYNDGHWPAGMLGDQDHLVQSVLDAIPAPVFLKDTNLRYTTCNRALEELLGKPREELIGNTFCNVNNDELLEASQSLDAALLAGEGPQVCDGALTCADGSVRRIKVHKALLQGPTGEPSGIIGVAFDTSDLTNAERALQEAHQFMDTLVSSAGEGIIVYDREMRHLLWNPAMEELTGLGADQVLGRNALDLFPHLRSADVAAIIDRTLSGEIVVAPDLFFSIPQTGRSGWTSAVCAPHRDANGEIIGVICLVRDVTERRRAETELKETTALLQGIFDGITDPIVVLKPDLEIVRLNEAAEGILGATAEVAVGRKCYHLRGQEHPCPNCFALASTGSSRSTCTEHFDALTGKWLENSTYPIHNDSGELVMFVEHLRDITEKKAHQAQLHQMAHYDHLTGLPNRFLFSDRLRQGIEEARRRGTCLAVMFLDVDGFKLVNDTLGHNAGDFLLKQIATRLRSALREEDLIARMGGDEFTIMLPHLRSAQDTAKVARKIHSALSEPFPVVGDEHYISASIGISVFPADGEDAESLVKNSDTAMYGAKERGRNTFHLYTEEMNIAVVERMTLGNSLRRALDREEFVLHYQPRVDVLSGETLGAESLMRWRRPGIGLVYPGKFIPTAEETGLISSMGEWALRAACRQNAEWQRQGMRPIQIAVNISARQFQHRSLPSLIRKILTETGLDPRWLDLELTESILMDNPDLTGSQLVHLKDMGVGLSIDDFGTGYSSLSYLQRFPVDAVKIDRSFIRDVTTNPESSAITRAIIAMADSLNLRVVAEGVETLEQVKVLKGLGCREIQGYLISRPVPPTEFVQVLESSGEWLQAA